MCMTSDALAVCKVRVLELAILIELVPHLATLTETTRPSDRLAEHDLYTRLEELVSGDGLLFRFSSTVGYVSPITFTR